MDLLYCKEERNGTGQFGEYSYRSLKISCKSVWKFLRKVANRKT